MSGPSLAAPESPPGERSGWGAALVLCLFFAALHLPAAASLAGYHGDERFYTDAALEMAQRGEWSLPRYADGSLRANKPLLTYWSLLVSYGTFGVGVLSSRLPFLLAMLGALLLTWRIAWVATKSRSIALTAALIYGATPAVSSTALRSTPDALQAFGVALALLGLVRLVMEPQTRLGALWVWLGVGVTVASKLSLGFLVAVFAVAAVLAWGQGSLSLRLRKLFHPLALLPGVAVGLLGTLPMYLVGDGALSQAVNDQVAGRMPSGPLWVLGNFLRYAADPVRHFAPFSLLALAALFFAWRSGRRATGGDRPRTPRPAWLPVAIGFLLLLIAIFAVGNLHRARYLLPAYPMAALLIAYGLHGALPRVQAFLGAANRWVLGVLAIAALAFVQHPQVTLFGLALVALGLGFDRVARRRAAHVPALAVTLMLLSSFVVSGVRPAFHETPLEELDLALAGPPSGVLVLDGAGVGSEDLAAKLRVVSGGRLRAVPHDAERLGLDETSGDSAGLDHPSVVGSLAWTERIEASLDGYRLAGTWPDESLHLPFSRSARAAGAQGRLVGLWTWAPQ